MVKSFGTIKIGSNDFKFFNLKLAAAKHEQMSIARDMHVLTVRFMYYKSMYMRIIGNEILSFIKKQKAVNKTKDKIKSYEKRITALEERIAKGTGTKSRTIKLLYKKVLTELMNRHKIKLLNEKIKGERSRIFAIRRSNPVEIDFKGVMESIAALSDSINKSSEESTDIIKYMPLQKVRCSKCDIKLSGKLSCGCQVCPFCFSFNVSKQLQFTIHLLCHCGKELEH
jgi:hypothetical protein